MPSASLSLSLTSRVDPASPAEPASAGVEATTICAECVYFYNMTPGLNTMPLALCSNPRFALPARVDFVTGRTLNEVRPCCETINHGHCPGFVRDRSRYLLFAIAALLAGLLFWLSLGPVPPPSG